MTASKNKLHPLALGITLAIISSISTFVVGVAAFILLNGKPLVSMVGTMYITYNPTLTNAALGAAIVFINAIIAGYVAAWIYNLLIEYI